VPSIYQLKPAFQSLLQPMTHSMARAGVTANQVTLAALLLSAANGALLVWRPEGRWPLLVLPE